MSKFVNIELYKFGQNVTKAAKINIGATRRGRRTESTGRLRKSVAFTSSKQNNRIDFIMEDYGAYVDSGRDGRKKKHRSKKGLIHQRNKPSMPPVRAIKKWINEKPIRPRNLKTNKFEKKTPARLNSMAFAMAKNIEKFGIKPTFFFSDAYRQYEKDLGDDLAEAVWNDFKEKL